MKPLPLKRRFVVMRAEGASLRRIADTLNVARGTLTRWEREFAAEVDACRRESLEELYDTYKMGKVARIERLGGALAKITAAVNNADLSVTPPEKLLELALKYGNALRAEYGDADAGYNLGAHANTEDIKDAFGKLLDRTSAGDVTIEQASREADILTSLLKAHEVGERTGESAADEAVTPVGIYYVTQDGRVEDSDAPIVQDSTGV